MVKYSITRNNDLCKISVNGHAMFSLYGKDIVCASVSTALIMTNNLIERLGFKDLITRIICDEGSFILEVKSNEIIEKIIDNLEQTLKELETQFPKYINSKN